MSIAVKTPRARTQNHFTTPKGTELPLLDLRGNDYLQVRDRLRWFREERPSWGIETEIVSVSDRAACIRAVIKDEQGRMLSTSHKTETLGGFPDFVEKAETGAVGRALALIGYGTQFCADDLDEGERVVDSPIARQGPSPEQKKEYAGRLGLDVLPSIKPEQPPEGEGFQDDEYRIGFGQWKHRSCAEVIRVFGKDRAVQYIEFLESTAQKKGRQLTPEVKDFILEMSREIVELENGAG